MLVKPLKDCFVDGSRRRKGEIFEYSGKLPPYLAKAEVEKLPIATLPEETLSSAISVPTNRELAAQLALAGVKLKGTESKATLLSLIEAEKQKVA